MIKLLVLCLCLPLVVGSYNKIIPQSYKALSDTKYENKLSKDVKIIKCINTKSLEVKNPIKGTCYLGKNRQNIMIPSKEQYKIWKEVFINEEMIINRLSIINFESGFDPNRIGRYKYGNDCGYAQIRDIYGGCKMGIKEQLVWMKTRQESQRLGNCSGYKNGNLIKCFYMRHLGARTIKHPYVNKVWKARQVYIDYFNS